jgi:hypothetical protein
MIDHDPRHRNPLVTGLMIVLGLPLLLPGVCSFFFERAGWDVPVVRFSAAIGLLGVALIFFGVRRMTAEPKPASVGESAKLVALVVLLMLIIGAVVAGWIGWSALSRVKLQN